MKPRKKSWLLSHAEHAKMASWRVKLAKRLLTDLSPDDAIACTELILNKLGALPLSEIIKTDDNGQLLINGELVELDQARKLQMQATLALENPAMKLILEQMKFAAIVYGVHKAESPTQILFARGALWWSQMVDSYLQTLAQRSLPPTEE